MPDHNVRARRSSIREFAPHADWSAFRSAVSLHAHTHHSREVMADLPRYIARIPVLSGILERQQRARREAGESAIDFSKGWWHPPVSPRALFESEEEQIDRRFGLMSLVSVTDHDDITAGLELQERYAARRAPVSFEWSVPYGQGFFHLGVHNLPPEGARSWFDRLSAFTTRASVETLPDLLRDLDAVKEVLLVFNHPMWDLAGVGADTHMVLLRTFMAEHGSRMHALELNGYRSRKENGGTRALSAESGVPIIGGGDRHACQPNAILNVSRASCFAEFASEVRDGVSDVVVMPEYRQHLAARKLSSVSEVLRHYRSYPAGRRRWTDRVSCDSRGSVRPLSYHWPSGGPLVVRSSIATIRILTGPVVLPVIRTALQTFHERPPVFPIPTSAPIETSTGVFRLGL